MNGIKECCKNCHWYDNQHCYHKETFASSDEDGYAVGMISEEGKVSEAIKEALDFSSFDYRLVKMNLFQIIHTKSKAEKALNLMLEFLEYMKPDIISEIDLKVTKVIDNELEDKQNLPTIIDPDNFCCNHYL